MEIVVSLGPSACYCFNYGGLETIVYQHNVAIVMMTFLLFGYKEWKFDQPSGYVSQYLLELYSARMLQDHLGVSRPTFTYLCHLFGPILSKIDTKFRSCYPIDVRILITLHQLDFCDILHTFAYLYGITTPSASIIVRTTFEGIKSCWGPCFFTKIHEANNL